MQTVEGSKKCWCRQPDKNGHVGILCFKCWMGGRSMPKVPESVWYFINYWSNRNAVQNDHPNLCERQAQA